MSSVRLSVYSPRSSSRLCRLRVTKAAAPEIPAQTPHRLRRLDLSRIGEGQHDCRPLAADNVCPSRGRHRISLNTSASSAMPVGKRACSSDSLFPASRRLPTRSWARSDGQGDGHANRRQHRIVSGGLPGIIGDVSLVALVGLTSPGRLYRRNCRQSWRRPASRLPSDTQPGKDCKALPDLFVASQRICSSASTRPEVRACTPRRKTRVLSIVSRFSLRALITAAALAKTVGSISGQFFAAQTPRAHTADVHTR